MIANGQNTCRISPLWLGVTQVVFCFTLMACMVPHPMTKRTEGTGKAELASQPDISQIHAGLKSRAEVLERFGSVKAWVSGRLFLGRWTLSYMGISGDRLWVARNLLIQFDDAGIVQR